MIRRICSLLRVRPPVTNDRGFLFASGASKPTDGTDNYQPGCIFQDTTNGALYVNEGSITSCDFNLIEGPGTLTIGDLTDLEDAYATRVVETGTYQSTASGGVTLSATNTRPVSFLFDDAGAALGAGDYRAVLSRVLLTKDSTNNVSLNPIRGHLKLLDGIDISGSGSIAGVRGYLELAGTGARTLTGHVGALRAAIEEGASGTTTVAASSVYAGLECTLNSTRTYSVTGEMAGIVVNISGGTSKWPEGILIPGTAVVKGMRIGKFVGSAATTAGVAFATAQDIYSDGQLAAFEVHGASASNLGSGYHATCARMRHVVNSTTCVHESYGATSQLVVKDTTLSHLHAGLLGTFEGHTSGVVVNSAYTYGVAGILSRVGGGGAITATTVLSGFTALWNGAALASGSSSAFSVGDTADAGLWTTGLSIERATNAFAFPADGTAPVAAGNYEIHGGTKVRISVTVGGSQYYMLASTDPTTQS
jgi:hypothetical protein